MAEVFTSPGALFDKLVVLTDDAVCVANPDDQHLSALAQQIQTGQPVKSVVPDATETRYADIRSVKANRHRDDFNIHHRQGAQSRQTNIAFEDAAARDRVFSALEKRLGPAYSRSEVQYGVFRAALAPILWAAGLSGFTYICYMAAAALAAGETADIHGRRTLLKLVFAWLLRVIGPKGVVVVGSLLVLACLWWLITRVKTPPLMVMLKRR